MAYKLLTTYNLEFKDYDKYKYDITLNCLTDDGELLTKDYNFVENSLNKESTAKLTIEQIVDIIMQGTTCIFKCQVDDKLEKTPLKYLIAEKIQL